MLHNHPFISVSFPTLGILAACCTVFTILLYLSPDRVLAQNSAENVPDINQLMQGKTYVYKLDPEDRAGKGYKLVYMVAAPLEAFWKFKTDFENDFLLTNKLITQHRLDELSVVRRNAPFFALYGSLGTRNNHTLN